MYSHQLHSLRPPPARGKGIVTSASGFTATTSSDDTPTPQSSSFSLRTAVSDHDEAGLPNFPELKVTEATLDSQTLLQRSASGDTAVEDIVHLGDLSATDLIGQLRYADEGSDAGASGRRSRRPLSLSDVVSRARTESLASTRTSSATEEDRTRSEAEGDETDKKGPTLDHAKAWTGSPRTAPIRPARRVQTGQQRETPQSPLGVPVKQLPNGLPAAGSASDTSYDHNASCSALLETQSEADDLSDYDEAEANRRKSFGTATPKLGGFGVRDDHIPHVEGMSSAATDRARKHQEETEAKMQRSRQRSKSDSRGSDSRASHHSSSNLVGKKREQLPGASEWGANFWCVITDPKTQASFFANPQTGECRWEVPSGTIVLPPNPDGEWWELYDEDRAIPYYYHTQTAKSSWERPKGFVIPLTAIQESTLGRSFSRREFGEDHISARASMAVSEEDRQAAGLATPSKTGKRASIQPAPPAHSPGIEQVLAGKARRRIMGTDRALVAQALAQQPLFRSSELGHSSIFGGQGEGNSRSRSNMRVAFEAGGHTKERSDGSRSTATGGSSSGGILRRKSSHPLSGGDWTKSSGRSRSKTFNASEMRRSVSQGTALSRPPALALREMRESASEPDHFHGRAVRDRAMTVGEPRTPARRALRRERDPAKRLSPIESLRSKASDPPPKPVKRLSTGDHLCMPTALQAEIKMLGFEAFAMRRFTTHRVGPFRRKLSIDQMARWQKSAINAPLLHFDFKELQRDAVKIFKVLQRIMGDRDSAVHAKPPTPLRLTYGIKMVEENSQSSPQSPRTPSHSTNGMPLLSPSLPDCLNASRNGKLTRPCDGSAGAFGDDDASSSRAPSILEEERWVLERGMLSMPMRDEIYSQVIKQLTDNPSGSSIFRGWQFLCVLLVTFPPSNDLRDSLEHFIEEHATDDDEAVAIMAQHCVGRLALICRRGARSSTPSIAEIQSASDAAFNPGVFGRSLDDIMATQRDAYPHVQVPIVLVFLCNAMLAVDALKTEGVFRVAGDADLVTELKCRIERGHYRLDGIAGIGGSDGDVAVLASELKQWLRELEDPLIPASLYDRCIQVAAQPSRCIDLVKTLPMTARRTLIYLISFLQLFVSPPVVRRTKMPAESLALIFAPTLFRKEPERLSVLFNNSKYEQHFVLSLLRHLPCADVDAGFTPIHATAEDDGSATAAAAAVQKVNVGGPGARSASMQGQRAGHSKTLSDSTTTDTSLFNAATTDEGWSSERSIFDGPVRLRPHSVNSVHSVAAEGAAKGGAGKGPLGLGFAWEKQREDSAGAEQQEVLIDEPPRSPLYGTLRHRPGMPLETVTDVSYSASSDD